MGVVPRCSKCGRVLRSPASIARGIGPECAGLRGALRVGRSGRVVGLGGAAYDVDGAGGAGGPLVVVHDDSVAELVEEGRNGG